MNPHDPLPSAVPREEIRGRTVRGGAAMIAAEAGKFLTSVAAVTVLARIISKQEYGVVEAVMAFTILVADLRDLGLAAATVQRREVTRGQLSAMFWINTGSGALLALLTALAAPLIASFVEDPRVQPVALTLALMFLLGGLGVQHEALLRRNLRFREVASIEIGSTLLASALAVALALAGAGLWALVAMHVSRAALLSLGAWALAGWLPGRPVWDHGAREMLRMGLRLAAFNILVGKTRQADRLIITLAFGTAPVGAYGRAANLIMIPLRRVGFPANRLIVPVLARLVDEPAEYRLYFRTALLLLTSVTMPIAAFAAVSAPATIHTILGPDWDAAVPLFAALALPAFMYSFESATRWLYTSTGRTGRQLRFGVLTSALVLVGMLVGLQWGPVGVILGMGIAMAAARLPEIAYCLPVTPVTWADLARALPRPAAASAWAALLAYAAGAIATPAPPATLALQAATFALAYAAVWAALPGGRNAIRTIKSLARDLRRPAPAPDPSPQK